MNEAIIDALNHVFENILKNEDLNIEVDVLTGSIDVVDVKKGIHIITWQNDLNTGDTSLSIENENYKYRAISFGECDQIFFRGYNKKEDQRFKIYQCNFMEHLYDLKWDYTED